MPKQLVKYLVRQGLQQAKALDLRAVDFSAQRVAVIVQYHAIGDAATGAHGYAKPSICLPADVFDRQIAFLAAHYRCVTMDELAAALDGGPPLPPNAALITFDDGYRDNYDLAFPILLRHRVPATFYVTTDCLDGGTPLWPSELRCLVHRSRRSRLPNPFGEGDHDVSTPERRDQAIEDIKVRLVRLSRRDREAALDVLRAKEDTSFLRETMLTWEQVREMAGKGMTFGSHTVSHPLLPSIPHEEAVTEIRDSKTVLEGQLGRPVRHFSYPNPGKGVHTDDAIRRVVAESGYATAVTTRRGYVSRTAGALDLSRMAVGQNTRDFIWNIESPALFGALSFFKTRGPAMTKAVRPAVTSSGNGAVATAPTNGAAGTPGIVRAGTEADLPAVARLYSPPHDLAVLRWLLDAGQGRAPHSFVAAEGDRIVGHNGYTLSRFRTRAGEVTGLHCMHWIMDGSYRGRGLGLDVFRATFPLADFAYVCGGTERSKALFAQMGFAKPFDLMQLAKVTRPLAWARTQQGPLARRLLKAAVLGARAHMTRPAFASRSSITAQPYDPRLRPAPDRPWPAVANVEEPGQIDWFLRCPVNAAQAFHIKRGDSVLGLAVCMVKEHAPGLRTGRIVHLSYLGEDPGVWRSALAVVEARLVEAGCSMISVFASHPRFLAALAGRGFVVRARVPVWIRDPNGRLPEEGWHLTGLEGDLGHRRV